MVSVTWQSGRYHPLKPRRQYAHPDELIEDNQLEKPLLQLITRFWCGVRATYQRFIFAEAWRKKIIVSNQISMVLSSAKVRAILIFHQNPTLLCMIGNQTQLKNVWFCWANVASTLLQHRARVSWLLNIIIMLFLL